MKEGLKLYAPFETAEDLPVGTWFIPHLSGDSAPGAGGPVVAYREEKQAVLLFTQGAARHALRLGDVQVQAVLGMPSQSGVPICTLPLAEWLEWAWVRFEGCTGESCLSHLKEEVQELDEAVTELNRGMAATSDFKTIGPLIDSAVMEAADVIALALHTGLRLFGTNLPVGMRKKLAVNRQRDWEAREDGSLRHVEPDPECGCDHCENGSGCEPQRRAEAAHYAEKARTLRLAADDGFSRDVLRAMSAIHQKNMAKRWRDAGKSFAAEMMKALGMDDGSGVPFNEDLKPEVLQALGHDCARRGRELAGKAQSASDWRERIRELRQENARLKSAQKVLRQAAEAMDKILHAMHSDEGTPDSMAGWVERFIAPPGEAWADKLTPEQHADRIVKKLERFDEYRKRSVILAAVEGILGRGQDEPFKNASEAKAQLRHHVGSTVLASLAEAVRAEENTLEAIQVAAARLLKYGRYRDTVGIPLAHGQVVSTPSGDTMRVDRVFLVDPDGTEVRDASSGLTWAAAGTVLTGFGGACTVVVQGPLTFLGWA